MDNTERIESIKRRLTNDGVGGFDIYPEWEDLVIKLDDDELSALDPDYTLSQVKEKFGGLRYYFMASEGTSYEDYEKMRNLVNMAENDSYALVSSYKADED